MKAHCTLLTQKFYVGTDCKPERIVLAANLQQRTESSHGVHIMEESGDIAYIHFHTSRVCLHDCPSQLSSTQA